MSPANFGEAEARGAEGIVYAKFGDKTEAVQV